MALVRGRVKRKQLKDELEKPTKEEYAIAKYLKFNTPSREGKFLGNDAQCFIGSKAIDTLLDSKWASAKNAKSNPLFTNRASCANYCERLLEKGFFQRAARPEKRDKKKRVKDAGPEGRLAEKSANREELKRRKQGGGAAEGGKGTAKEETATKEKKGEKKGGKKGDESPTAGEGQETSAAGGLAAAKDGKSTEGEKPKDDAAGEEKKRRKKKIKLEPHEKQVFIDGPELYVWLYDPVQVKTFIIGLFLVLGAIAVCLFPLWPPEVRLGIYYLSLAAAGFVGLILSLCIVRMILFCLVWLLTIGRVSFWLLPNLTEDVGFFDSFRPLYHFQSNSAAAAAAAAAAAGKKDEDAASSECTGEADTPENIGAVGEGNTFAGGNIDDDSKMAAEAGSGANDDGGEDGEEEEAGEHGDEEDEEEGRNSGGSSNSYEIVDPNDVVDDDEEAGPVAEGDNQSEQSDGDEGEEPDAVKKRK